MNNSFTTWLGLLGLMAVLCGCGGVAVVETDSETENSSEQTEVDIATEETMYDDADQETSETDHSQEADEDLFDTAVLADVSKSEFVKGLDAQMKRLDEQIEKFETNSDQIRADVQRRWETTLKALREERAELGDEYKELKAANGDLWEDFRATVMASWNKTRVALEKADRDFERYMEK